MPLTFIPFILVLVALSLFSTLMPKTWEKIEEAFLLAVSLLGGVVIWKYHGLEPIKHTIQSDYVPFMTMMVVLALVSSLLAFHKGGKATPLYNTFYLAFGAVISNVIGTMAAAMVMWPPLTHLNRHQASFQHGFVFFIFIVCNVGACLTPIGDPPLLVGYLRGVPFDWMLKNAWKDWLLVVPPLLVMFYLFDKKRNPQHEDPPYMLHKPSIQAFILLGVVLTITIACPLQYREFALFLAGLWAWVLRGRINGPIMRNIAVLFLALFITLIPIQLWLADNAHRFVSQSPLVNFWTAGVLSAFLDNTPTYIVWTQLHGNDLLQLAQNKPHILEAISLGCVWMGALSYIGNAPNLIVRAYSYKHAPSFLGYMKWSCSILIPLFAVVSWILW